MSVEPLLHFIRQHESRGNYNIVWGGISKSDRPSKPLTKMTIREVLDWQDSIDAKYRSEAAGAYQIMEDTLRKLFLMVPGLTLDSLFNEANQDKLAIALLERRGLKEFLSGHVSAQVFGQSVSQEWASLPCVIKDAKGRPAKGQSYYDGDGLNRSGTSIDEFVGVIRQVKDSPVPQVFEAVMEVAKDVAVEAVVTEVVEKAASKSLAAKIAAWIFAAAVRKG